MKVKIYFGPLFLVSIVLAILLLAACAAPMVPTAPTEAEVAPSENTEAPSADTEAPAEAKIVRVHNHSKDLSIGLQPWCSANFPSSTLVFMNLVHWTDDGELSPGLALSWESNEDATEWTFHLDPQAIFHDGTPVTAAEVKAAYEVGYRLDIQCSWGGNQGFVMTNVVGSQDALTNATADSYPDVPGIIAQDEHTLVFKLTAPDLGFPGGMSNYVSGVFKADQFKNDHKGWIQQPIGSGPYKIVDMDPPRAAYRAVRAETWWREPPKIDEIHVVGFAEPQTSLLMYKNDEIDLMLAQRIDLSQVFGTPLGDEWWPNQYVSNWFTFIMWQDKPPFDDLLVRKAFVHALDYDAAFNAVFTNYPAAEPHTQALPPNYECYTEKHPWQFDPELAKKELAESSYGGPEGLPLITLVYGSSDVLPSRLAQIYQKMWEDNLGVKVELAIRQPGDDEIFKTANIRRMSDGYTQNNANWFLNLWRSDAWGVCGQEGTRACTRLSGQPLPDFYVELDEMLTETSKIARDDPKYCEAWSEVEDVINNNFHWIPGYNLRYGWMVKPWLRNMSGSYNSEEVPTIMMGTFDVVKE